MLFDKKAVCPDDPTHARFVAPAHEVHDWVVDAKGYFLEDKKYTDTTHEPDENDPWTCAECGALAVIVEDKG